MQNRIRGFTTRENSISNVLINQVEIFPSKPEQLDPSAKIDCRAIWDTGSSLTCITPKIVDQLGLQESGITNMVGINGKSEKTSIFIVDVCLPNGVCLLGVDVVVMNLTDDYDVLIGMNIINLGDLAVSNFNGKTVFSFRIPSVESTDFMTTQYRAFTVREDSICGALINQVGISSSNLSKTGQPDPSTKIDYRASWDTGSSRTHITPKIVDQLGLQESGITDLVGANGKSEKTSTFIVDVWLPNGFCIFDENAVLANLASSDYDVLIGMDIINLGDLAISNFNEKTVFSFRIPSVESTDFMTTNNNQNHRPRISGSHRNQPCPCGSGKKSKHCCYS